jgi:hypothetical protein
MSDDQSVVPIRLSEDMVTDLTDLVVNCGSIGEIIEAAAQVLPAPSIRAFASRVAKRTTGIEAGVVFHVLFTLVNVRRMQRARDVDSARMIVILTASLERYAPRKWRKLYLDKWKDACQTITQAVEAIRDDHPLFVSEKAETLAFSDQNILTSQRIITELRPVFDTDGDNIKETLILHTLLIEYYDGISSPRRIAFTLDSADVQALRQSCDRAERKTETSLKAVSSLNPIQLPEDPES